MARLAGWALGIAIMLPMVAMAQPRLASTQNGLDDPVTVGVLRPDGLVGDPVFGIAAPALGLAREVEMYQWIEVAAPVATEAEAAGSGPTHQYRMGWSSQAIDSLAFAEPEDHENPGPLPFASERWFAETAVLDGMTVSSSSLWRDLPGWQPLSPDPTALPANLALLFVGNGDGLSTSQDPDLPEIGDLRVRWLALPGGPVRGELVRDGDAYVAASEAVGFERLPTLPDTVPGLDSPRRLASDLWLWLVGAVIFGLLLVAVIVNRSRLRIR